MTPTKKPTDGHSLPRKGLTREARIMLLIGVPLFVWGYIISTRSPDSVPTVEATQLVQDDSPTLGPASAPVTLVEFLDPECESCRAAFPAIKQIVADYGDQVRLVVRYFPLHGNSVLAAAATEAAGAQGKYWEMQELLFERQPEWGEQQTPQTTLFTQYAQDLNLDIERFVDDLDNPEILAKIERDRADGVAVGVTGTPTFFINGQLVEPLSGERIVTMIEEELDS